MAWQRTGVPAVSLVCEGNLPRDENDAITTEEAPSYEANRKPDTCVLSAAGWQATEGDEETGTLPPKNLVAAAGEGQSGGEGFAARASGEESNEEATRFGRAPSMVLVPEEIGAKIGEADPEAAHGRAKPQVTAAKPVLCR